MRHLAVVVLLIVAFLSTAAMAGVMITVLDVGQGDATLVQSTSGITLLFDGGPNGSGSGVVLPYLASQGISSLDYIVASHYHADHIGGLDEVYTHTGATEGVWDRGWSYTTITYTSYANTVFDDRQTIADGQVFDLGDGVTATCFALNGNGQLNAPYDNSTYENEYCVALLIECGDFDYLQAGDFIGTNDGSHVDIETSLAAELAGLDKANLEVYKVNHHGSYTSSNAAFLNTVTPEVAVISVGATNSYGHPHEAPMVRLQTRDVFVYQTTPGNGYVLPPSDMTVVNGHVVIETTGQETYTVDGDLWDMDEQGGTPVAMSPAPFALFGNHPNPFNPATVISFHSEHGGSGLLEVYNVAGRRCTQEHFTVGPGLATVPWRGRDAFDRPLPAGVYVYRVTVADGSRAGRMLLAK